MVNARRSGGQPKALDVLYRIQLMVYNQWGETATREALPLEWKSVLINMCIDSRTLISFRQIHSLTVCEAFIDAISMEWSECLSCD